MQRIFSTREYADQYRPMVFGIGGGDITLHKRIERLKFDVDSACRRLSSIRERLDLIPVAEGAAAPAQIKPTKKTEIDSLKIFIVHGHNNEAKQELGRTLEKGKLQAVILHEQDDVGALTVIQKFERHSEVGAAIVLLTADDEGKSVSATDLQKRARQNVVFEMGYFMGKLGLDRVIVLLKDAPEIPSDLAGIVYINMDAGGAWRYQMGRALRAMNIPIDLNEI